MATVSPEFVHSLPKIDLHLHLDGAVRTQTLLDLARQQNVPLPGDTPDALAPFVTVGPECRSLGDFLKVFDVFYPLLRSPSAVERLAYELCEDQASDNVVYFEARFAPVLQAGEQGDIPDVVEAALQGLGRGMRDFDVKAGLLLCCYRSEAPQSSLETVDAALEHFGAGVAGIDLAGDEAGHPVGGHEKAFRKAREAGLPITAHAGEVSGPESIRDAIFRLGAQRIGHGVRLFEDEDLLRRVVEFSTPLEICLTSNLQTGAWPDLATHPFNEYFLEGARVFLNTDDPAVSRTTLTREYLLAAEAFDLTVSDIRKLLLSAAEAAFINDEFRTDLRERIERHFHAHE